MMGNERRIRNKIGFGKGSLIGNLIGNLIKKNRVGDKGFDREKSGIGSLIKGLIGKFDRE